MELSSNDGRYLTACGTNSSWSERKSSSVQMQTLQAVILRVGSGWQECRGKEIHVQGSEKEGR